MKSSNAFSKKISKIVAAFSSCFVTIPVACCQNTVSASTIHSQEDIHTARFVFTNDIYSKIKDYVSRGYHPRCIAKDTKNGCTYLYFYFNEKMLLGEDQLAALDIIKDAFGLKDRMDVIKDAKTYIVSSYSDEQVYNARLVFTSDLYSLLEDYKGQQCWPKRIGKDMNNGRTYLYLSWDQKIELDKKLLDALDVLTDYYKLKDRMEVIKNAKKYIVNAYF